MNYTNHPLSFDRLSPRDFERLTLWLARREGYDEVEHRGASGGDRGRDLLACKDGRRIAFQCKREKAFGPRDAEEAVEAILRLPAEDLPDELVIVTACDVSDAARQSAGERCAGRLSCAFWALTELDERVKRHPDVVEEFFGAPRGTPGVPFVLPQADTASFTGREGEVARLRELLVERTGPRLCSIVGLAGTGGIGKSALAAHFAALHQADFPDGVIGLRVDGKDPGTLAREFARSCGVEIDPEDERSASALMQEIFRHRRALLIFDNADDASVRELLPGGDRCAVIVTTRDRSLPSLLDVPETAAIDLPVLPPDECEDLLRFLLGAERVAAEPAAISEIVALVGRLPLALQIVGHTLREQPWRSLADYSRSLAEERSRLERLRVRGASHLDVRASFSLGLQALSEPEIDFLACLSVCARGGFSLRGALAAGGLDEATTSDSLGTLCRYSLLNTSEGEGALFIFHPLIHLFASELAEERDLQSAAEERHALEFADWVKSLGDRTSDAFGQLAGDIDDILLAAERLRLRRRPDYELLIRLEPFLQQGGYWREATDLMAKFLSLAEEIGDWNAAVQLRIQQAKYLSLAGRLEQAKAVLSPVGELLQRMEASPGRQRSEAMWLNTLGGIVQRLGRFGEAGDLLQRGYEVEVALDNQRGQAKVLNSLGGIYQRQGHFDEAVDAFERCYALEIQLDNTRGQAMALNSLGGVYQRLGRFDKAVDAFQRSYLLLSESGDRRGQAMVLNSLGGVYQREGRFDQAVDAFQRSHDLEVELDNVRGQAMVLNSLGGVYQRQGRFDQAVDEFQRSYDISEELDDRVCLAMVLNSLGGVYQRQGRFDQAVNAFQRSYDISAELGDRRSLAMILNSLGGVYQRQSQFEQAIDAFQRSYKLLNELCDRRGQAMVLNSLGGVYQRQGRFDQAVDAFQQSFKLLTALGDRRGQAMVLNSLGGVHQRQGRFDQAANAFQRSYDISEELGDRRSLAMVLNSLGGVYQRQGQFELAVNAFQRSYDISEELNDRVCIAMVLNSLGGVYQRQGQFEKAVDAFQRSYQLLTELGDRRGQAMVLNSLGGVYQRQGLFKKSENSFRASIEIGEELGDRRHLSMVHTSFGKALAAQNRLEEATRELQIGFEIDIQLRNGRGLGLVTPALAEVLQTLGRVEEARDCCRRALEVAPRERKLLALEARRAGSLGGEEAFKRGVVKRILRHQRGYRFAFITPEDGGPDVYAREGYAGDLSGLSEGLAVEILVEQGPQGPRVARWRPAG